ncbi:MAG: transcription termination/antitermination factor NusG [Gemmatimonadales bacterium]|nr:MAG: transcription termination/antitermination factor NusG [Gemmatimonadales bacterium]
MAEPAWYAVQSYSGHENKVQRLIEQRIELEQGDIPPEEREVQEVLVPTQEATEIRNGKRVQVTRRLYPGYVLVKMVYNERTQHLVNSVQGVIKFVGSGAGDPRPLREEEMNKILGIEEDGGGEDVRDVPFHAGQVVEITQGPFTDFSGTVHEVFPDKGKVKVEVSLFGRPTSVELDFTQLKGY